MRWPSGETVIVRMTCEERVGILHEDLVSGEGTLAQRRSCMCRDPVLLMHREEVGREAGPNCPGPWALCRGVRTAPPLPYPDVFSEAVRSGRRSWLLLKISEKPHLTLTSSSISLPAAPKHGPSPCSFSTSFWNPERSKSQGFFLSLPQTNFIFNFNFCSTNLT